MPFDSSEKRAIGLAICGVLVSLIGAGISMSGYENPALGAVLIWVGLIGAVASLIWGWWSQIRSQPWNRRSDHVATAEIIAADVRSYNSELDQLYRESQKDPTADDFLRASRAWERADTLLIPWKRRVLEFLDSTVGHDAALQFYRLGTKLQSGAPGAHVQSSYQEHRNYLGRIAA